MRLQHPHTLNAGRRDGAHNIPGHVWFEGKWCHTSAAWETVEGFGGGGGGGGGCLMWMSAYFEEKLRDFHFQAVCDLLYVTLLCVVYAFFVSL